MTSGHGALPSSGRLSIARAGKRENDDRSGQRLTRKPGESAPLAPAVSRRSQTCECRRTPSSLRVRRSTALSLPEFRPNGRDTLLWITYPRSTPKVKGRVRVGGPHAFRRRSDTRPCVMWCCRDRELHSLGMQRGSHIPAGTQNCTLATRGTHPRRVPSVSLTAVSSRRHLPPINGTRRPAPIEM